jgi:serine/threonine-protein kinase
LSDEIKIGEVLDKRFEITAFIERSGMATIFKAIDCQTGRTVALKVPHLEFEGNPKNSARFAREASILGKLDHPGIPKVVPVTQKSRPYVAMEYIEGETLYDVLKQTQRLPEREALKLASRLCEILDYLHRHHVVHCDLKPGNIMITNEGNPYLIDFGIAKGPVTEPFMFGWFPPSTGTPEYMAPEQIDGGGVDVRTDIYGLGAILYETVTGVRPLRSDLTPPCELNNSITGQLEEVILHAMAPRPSDRYSSAAAMKAELDSPETVQVTGMYRHPRKASLWPKRLKLAVFVVSLAAAPVILFFFFLWVFQRQLESRSAK